MDNYLAYYRCQLEAIPESLSQLLQFREIFMRIEKALSYKPSAYLFSERISILEKFFTTQPIFVN